MDPIDGRPSAGRGGLGTAVDTYRGWPRWARIAAPVGAGVLVLGGIGSATGAGDEDDAERDEAASVVESTTTTAAAPTIDDAVDVAAEHAPSGLNASELERLIVATCDGMADGAGERHAGEVYDDVAAAVGPNGDVDEAVEATGAGAELFCPDEVADAPGFLRAIVAAAPIEPVEPVTTVPPTTAPAPATTAASTTTAPPVTAPPVTEPPVTAPPVTEPPVTSPPVTEPPPSAYYANCSEARAAGAAPVHRGDPGYGSHLDRDGDGVGCES